MEMIAAQIYFVTNIPVLSLFGLLKLLHNIWLKYFQPCMPTPSFLVLFSEVMGNCEPNLLSFYTEILNLENKGSATSLSIASSFLFIGEKKIRWT